MLSRERRLFTVLLGCSGVCIIASAWFRKSWNFGAAETWVQWSAIPFLLAWVFAAYRHWQGSDFEGALENMAGELALAPIFFVVSMGFHAAGLAPAPIFFAVTLGFLVAKKYLW